MGIAFQLVDDVLNFDVDGEYSGGTKKKTRKGTLTDLRSGVVTAPVLYAARLYPDELNPPIEHKFKEEGDVELVVKYLRRSDGILRTRDLARVHANLAVRAAFELGSSGGVGGNDGVSDEEEEGGKLKSCRYRDSLIHLAYSVVDQVG